jgi:uncharacterized protein YecE (DUF72 family)
MDYRIGCSGYYYPGWKNKFYPANVASRNWLAYYSTVFNTLELNGTFYRLPKLETLKKYANATPEDFRFSVKASRYITHIRRLQECRQTVSDFVALMREGLGDKLASILFQFPATFKYSEENLARILENVPLEEQNVFEFRDISWWNTAVTTTFENNNLTFCNIDYPRLKTAFVHTSRIFYLRLHGSPDLFKSPYTILQLQEFTTAFPGNATRIQVYFNNTYFDAGYTNAAQLQQLIARI